MSCELSPVRISATGPDGAGKDTAWRNARPYLPEALRILKIGKPTSLVFDEKEHYVDVAISHFLDWVHGWADRRRNRALTSMANCAYILFQWRIQEPLWTIRFHPDMVFSLRDGYADPAAYAPFYMPDTLGKLTIPQRIVRLQEIHGSPFRRHTVFLDIEPAIAVARIAERLEREKTMDGLLRPKWVHMHENETGLTAIRNEFFAVLKYLENSRGVRVSTIDASQSRGLVGQTLAENILSNVRT